ncbi:hypothetical protein Tco_1363510 [Tanacetum coccineum]
MAKRLLYSSSSDLYSSLDSRVRVCSAFDCFPYGDADDVDVHLYRSMIGSLMYLTASRPDIMFACKKQNVVATSTTEAEYVAAASCCGQVKHVEYLMLNASPFEVGDEAAHKELGDSMKRAATTTSSLEAEQDSGNINKTQSIATLNGSSP